ncbi:hypothetical protein GCM10023187_01760 [Nibrella viscosa]|uniref:DUF104 domain-containing protein n=1 Tax=Nibrella viscosa TaxID=1084524 RepID=A0ABP8JSP0_9BACT
MKTVRGIYNNGELKLEEELPTEGAVEVVIVYNEKAVRPKKKSVVQLPTI